MPYTHILHDFKANDLKHESSQQNNVFPKGALPVREVCSTYPGSILSLLFQNLFLLIRSVLIYSCILYSI